MQSLARFGCTAEVQSENTFKCERTAVAGHITGLALEQPSLTNLTYSFVLKFSRNLKTLLTLT